MIYLIQRDGTHEFKLGYSKHPEKRLKQLQTGNAKKLILRKVWDGDRTLEKKIHDKLRVSIKDKQYKIGRGEWFWIDDNWLRVVLFEISTRMV